MTVFDLMVIIETGVTEGKCLFVYSILGVFTSLMFQVTGSFLPFNLGKFIIFILLNTVIFLILSVMEV